MTATFNGRVLTSRRLGAGPDWSGPGRRLSMVVGRLSKLGVQGGPVAVALAGPSRHFSPERRGPKYVVATDQIC